MIKKYELKLTKQQLKVIDNGLVALGQAKYIINYSIPKEQRTILELLEADIRKLRLLIYDTQNKKVKKRITNKVKN